MAITLNGSTGVTAAYRQELLDVPAQAGFPNNITWPQELTTWVHFE